MKKTILQELPWFLAHLAWFLVIPLLYSGTEISLELAYLMLMIGNPLFCMIVSLLYGMKYGRKWGFLCYPIMTWIPSMIMYYNRSAMMFGVIAMLCTAVGLIFGGWLYHRRQSEAEKWGEPQVPAAALEKHSDVQNNTIRTASKTAAKNQQKAAARKAKERAQKEQKLQNKKAPQKKKKKGGH